MKKRRLLVVGLTIALAVSLSLIFEGSLFPGQSRGQKPRFVLILKMTDFSNEFWRTVRDGALTSSEDNQVDLVIRGALDERQIDEQIKILHETVAEKPAAIILAAADYTRLVPGVREARQAGIPVVTIDSFIATEDANARIGTDNLALGKRCADILLRILQPDQEVAVLSYIEGSSTAQDREKGLISTLGTRFRLLPTLYSGSDSALAYKETKELLANDVKVKALVALNEPTALGAAKALKESGLKDRVLLVGVDQSFELLKAVEEGTINSLLVQQPFNMGYLGIETAKKLIDNRPVKPYVDTGSIEIGRTTMFLPQNQKLLFPVDVSKP